MSVVPLHVAVKTLKSGANTEHGVGVDFNVARLNRMVTVGRYWEQTQAINGS
jgi:hypothetical protein